MNENVIPGGCPPGAVGVVSNSLLVTLLDWNPGCCGHLCACLKAAGWIWVTVGHCGSRGLSLPKQNVWVGCCFFCLFCLGFLSQADHGTSRVEGFPSDDRHTSACH